MLCRVFSDFVIVFAMCLVVWGTVPALVVAQGTQWPPSGDMIYAPDGLPEGMLLSNASGIARCCHKKGSAETCRKNRYLASNVCLNASDVHCDYTYTYTLIVWYTQSCVCRNWAYGTANYGNGYYTLKCECSI
jgi:hypothetical protein